MITNEMAQIIKSDQELIDFITENNISEAEVINHIGTFISYIKLKEDEQTKVNLTYNNNSIEIEYVANRSVLNTKKINDNIIFNNIINKDEFLNKVMFDFTVNEREKIKPILNEYIGNNKCTNLYICGESCSGKTQLLAAIAYKYATDLNKKVAFVSWIEFTIDFWDFNKRDNNILTKLKKSEVLLIDDLGQEQVSEQTNQWLFSILNYRVNNNLKTIIGSQLARNDLQNILVNKINNNQAISTVNKVFNNAMVIELNKTV